MRDIRLNFELLEKRQLLTAFTLALNEILDASGTTKAVADFDGDGDLDGVTFTDRIVFRENVDGLGTFEDRELDVRAPYRVIQVELADIDRDQDLDIVYVSPVSIDIEGGQVGWIPNTGGGEFGRPIVIANFFSPIINLTVGDFSFAQGVDVVVSTTTTTYLVSNLDNFGTFGEITVLATDNRFAFGGDIDGDGDLDVILTKTDRSPQSNGEPSAFWLEHVGSAFLSPNNRKEIVAPAGADPLLVRIVVDLNLDGKVDLVASQASTIDWLPNLGNGEFAEARRIFGGPHAIWPFVDIDADGDLDALTDGGNSVGVSWAENLGNEEFAELKVLHASVSIGLVFPGDIDGDGDLDLMFAGSSLTEQGWLDQRPAGDADDNGKVEFADFLRLSANFGKVDAVWQDGDFDGSEKVDFVDFLLLASNFIIDE